MHTQVVPPTGQCATLCFATKRRHRHCAGPFWYASGATIQVLLFAILAIEVKLKAPRAHTILEIIKVRWGTTAHLVFMFFAFSTNIIVSAMLILGGASVVQALTGMNLYAAAFLIPVGVILYTAAGGLKAAFMSAYIHTAILYIALCIFTFSIYSSSEANIGSPGKARPMICCLLLLASR
jgi:urea-proton symporter